jgi:hypothetical protein
MEVSVQSPHIGSPLAGVAGEQRDLLQWALKKPIVGVPPIPRRWTTVEDQILSLAVNSYPVCGVKDSFEKASERRGKENNEWT